jgi:hypothetical protein
MKKDTLYLHKKSRALYVYSGNHIVGHREGRTLAEFTPKALIDGLDECFIYSPDWFYMEDMIQTIRICTVIVPR